MEAKGDNEVKIPQDIAPPTAGPVTEMSGLLSEDSKNLKQVTCQFCPCKILPPNMGSYEDSKEYELQIVKKNDQGAIHMTK